MGVKVKKQLRMGLAASWPRVVERLEAAAIVMDAERNLVYVSPQARRLLGYGPEDPIDGRCRLTTRGADCEGACPLTFALEERAELVEGFPAVYRRKDGGTVELDVTIIPLAGEDGSFAGAIELLRSRNVDLGFYLAGSSAVAKELRRQVWDLARRPDGVVVLGEQLARLDVARGIHRASGLADELFRLGATASQEELGWPPGTVYVDSPAEGSGWRQPRVGEWRVVVGLHARENPAPFVDAEFTALALPPLEDRREDLPLMLAAWIERLRPGLRASPAGLERLARIALDVGLGGVQQVLTAAVAGASGELTEGCLPVNGYGIHMVDDALRSDDPLAAVERCVLLETLERCGWRMQEAADRLGISRVTLWRKLRDHGIERA